MLLDDARMIHETTPIQPLAEVVTATHWSSPVAVAIFRALMCWGVSLWFINTRA